MKSKKYTDASLYYIGNSFYYLKNYKKAKQKFETVVKKHRTGGYHSASLYLLGRSDLLLKNNT